MKSKYFKDNLIASLIFFLYSCLLMTSSALAQEYYLGEIKWFITDYCPENFLVANGQVLPTAGNEALFSLVADRFGGNGTTNFALPDLRGRAPIGAGNLSTTGTVYTAGAQGGVESVTLSEAQIPSHTHDFRVSDKRAITKDGTGETVIAQSGIFNDSAAANIALDSSTLTATGNGQAHENRPPFLVLTPCVAVDEGVYPVRP